MATKKKISTMPVTGPVKPGEKREISPEEFKLHKAIEQYRIGPKQAIRAQSILVQIEKLKQQLADLKKQQELVQKKKKDIEAQQKANVYEPKHLNYLNMVMRDCTQMVSAIQSSGKFLYRGVKHTKVDAFLGKPWLERKAKDTTNKMQQTVDNVLSLAGFKALRGNSIYCTSDYYQARSYSDYGQGGVYLIFPKDVFDFTYSTKYSDFYSDYAQDYSPKNFIDARKKYGSVDVDKVVEIFDIASDKLRGEYFKIKNGPDKKLTNLLDNIYSLAESLRAKFKYGSFDEIKDKSKFVSFITIYKTLIDNYGPKFKFRFSNDGLAQLRAIWNWIHSPKVKDANTSIDQTAAIKIARYHGFKNTDLSYALKKKNEIYINGEYYAFRNDIFYAFFKQALLGKTPETKK